jgi:hypothetical protein
VSQGDIFLEVPITHVIFGPTGEVHTAEVRPVTAAILSRDCDYDKKSSQWVIVAEVRPLVNVAEGSQGNIRQFRTKNTFYLPSIGEHFPESYIDLGKIDRISKPAIVNLAGLQKRVGSLDDESRLALQRQIAIFFGFENPR